MGGDDTTHPQEARHHIWKHLQRLTGNNNAKIQAGSRQCGPQAKSSITGRRALRQAKSCKEHH